MDNYIALVKKLSESNSSEIINNSSADHASVLLAEMFRKGQGDAYIFSGALNPAIYGREDVAGTIGTYLTEGRGNLKVVVQSGADFVSDDDLCGGKQLGLLHQLKLRFGSDVISKVEVKRGTEAMQTYPCHFTVVGKKAFRFEPDKNKHEAFASFNQPDMVSQLAGLFETFWSQSTPVAMTN